LLGVLKAMKGRLWGWASHFVGAQLGKLEEGSSTGDLERKMKGTLEVWCLSLWELCEGNVDGGLSCWGP